MASSAKSTLGGYWNHHRVGHIFRLWGAARLPCQYGRIGKTEHNLGAISGEELVSRQGMGRDFW